MYGRMKMSDEGAGYDQSMSYGGGDYGPPPAGSYAGGLMYMHDLYAGADHDQVSSAYNSGNHGGKKGRGQPQQRWSGTNNAQKLSCNIAANSASSKMQESYNNQMDSDDEGYRSSGSTVQQGQMLQFQPKNNKSNNIAQNMQQAAHARKGKDQGGAGLVSSNTRSVFVSPPSQTVVIHVLTQCAECVRKVKKAVARTEGMESISVDMNLRRITVKGNIDPQNVLKRASKTGKSIEILSSKGSTIKPLHQASRPDRQLYFEDPNYLTPEKPTQFNQHSEGGKHPKGMDQTNQAQMKGVRFNLNQGEADPQSNNGKRFIPKNTMHAYKQGGQLNLGGHSKEMADYYDPEALEISSQISDSYLSYAKSERLSQDPEQYYMRSAAGAQKFKQKQSQSEMQSSGDDMILKQNLVYPASRDDGSYIFSEDNANNCCVM